MRIIVNDAGISAGSLLKLIAVGWMVGAGIFFIPVFLMAALTGVLWLHEGLGFEGIIFVVFLPFAVALQGLVLGAFVLFGLWIYRKFKDIEVQRPGG